MAFNVQDKHVVK